ncbi:uncharacterized protein F5147DRAFT_770420 [Suillus discolor]|uniref:Uncharacterized protein n=1 Tax=Suillus discolor TaxID=1912936 RepID=A0A9P7FDS1_9AGAM|nr:uncharacterized protein F5147DRAFT_770420 [Suillus discolor]KAG2113779.1 hypothetical protein F5147DRAFT_770420 [Suillus discolor]
MTCENGMHGLYQYVDDIDIVGRTVVHIAHYPTGYQKICSSNLADFSDIFSVSGQEASTIPQSWIGSESAYINVPGPSSAVGLQAVMPANPPTKRVVGRSLHRIMMACPQWRYPLAYLWVFIRIAMCSSGTQNPHLLTSQRAQRQQVIDQLWPISLTKTNVAPSSLETVLSKTNKKPISEHEILGLTSAWFSQFFYDVRRTLGYIIDDSHAGLGFGDGVFGDVLMDKILDALQMFLRPHAHLLPLAMAKENMCGVRLTIADLESVMFKHAPHPPWETTVFLRSSLYQVLLQRLVNSSSDPISLADYPTPSQIFMELKETGPMLFQQHDDPDIQPFRQALRSLCVITETDVLHITRPSNQPSVLRV